MLNLEPKLKNMGASSPALSIRMDATGLPADICFAWTLFIHPNLGMCHPTLPWQLSALLEFSPAWIISCLYYLQCLSLCKAASLPLLVVRSSPEPVNWAWRQSVGPGPSPSPSCCLWLIQGWQTERWEGGRWGGGVAKMTVTFQDTRQKMIVFFVSWVCFFPSRLPWKSFRLRRSKTHVSHTPALSSLPFWCCNIFYVAGIQRGK